MINFFETLFEARERKFQQEKLFRGESVDLVARITTDGVLDQLSDYQISGVYQPTDNLSGPFYPMDAEIIDGKAILHWTGDNDFGKNGYNVWGLLTKDGKAAYPVCWRLNMAHSPSYPLSSVDPIPRTIDFSQYDLLNAPWLPLSGDVMEADATIRFPLSDDIKVSIGKDGFGITKEITTETEAMSGYCWSTIPDPVPDYEIQWFTESEIANWDWSQGAPPWENPRLRLCATKPEETTTEISSIAKFSLPDDEEGEKTFATREWAQDKVDAVEEKLGDYLPLSGGTVSGDFAVENFLSSTDRGVFLGKNQDLNQYAELAIGNNLSVGMVGLAIGSNSEAQNNGITIGHNAKSPYGGGNIVIGNDASTAANGTTVVGTSAKASGGNAIAIGIFANATHNGEVRLGGPQGNLEPQLWLFDTPILSGPNTVLLPERIPYLSDYQTKADAVTEHQTLSTDLTAYVEERIGEIPVPEPPTFSNLTLQSNGNTIATYNPNSSQNLSANFVIPTRVSDLEGSEDLVTQDELSTELSDYATEQYVQDYVEQHGGGSTGEISACLSSLEFENIEPLSGDITSYALSTYIAKLNEVIYALKRYTPPEPPTPVEPETTKFYFQDGTVTETDIVGEMGTTYRYNSDLVKVEFGSHVTSIGNTAFNACSKLSAVTFSSTITEIKQDAFNNSKLVNVVVPGTVKTLGASVFRAISTLSSVVFEDGVEFIDESCFYGSSVKSVTFPSTITEISHDMFAFAYSVNSVNIPSGVTTINYSAFYSTTGMGDLIVPSTVTSIGNNAFYNFANSTSGKITFDGRTTAQVQAMSGYPWGANTSKIQGSL